MRFESFVRRTVQALNKTGLEHVIVDGLAAIIYGRIKATIDVDAVINIQPSNRDAVGRLISAFRNNGLEVFEHEIISSLKDKRRFSVFDTKSPFRVDVKGVYTSLESKALENRRKAKLLDLDVWVASPEDTVITKLVYGAPQDIEDAISVIINVKDKLNFEYLNQQAKQEKVHKQLKELLKKIK